MNLLRWNSWTLVLVCFLGCARVTVHRTGSPDLLDTVRDCALGVEEVSPRTLQTLRLLDLDELHHRAPADAIARLQSLAEQDPQPERVFALAEMCYARGRQAEREESPAAPIFYYLSAGYAYHYLFDDTSAGVIKADKLSTQYSVRGAQDSEPDSPPSQDSQPSTPYPALDSQYSALGTQTQSPAPAPQYLPPPTELPPSLTKDEHSPLTTHHSPFDPRFRQACDLYNTALAKCVRIVNRTGQLDPRVQLRIPTPDGRAFALSVVHHGFAWQPGEFGKLLVAGDFEPEGLDRRYGNRGLGVALIACRAVPDQTGMHAEVPPRSLYPPEICFPATAFLEFTGSLADLHTERSARLDLYNPLVTETVDVGGQRIPLESDLTTPLAYFLSHGHLDNLGLTGFLHADQLADRAGLYLVEPYQAGKIPVVFVHGFMSSPATWAPLYNDLLADAEMRKKYQFWFYLYPTGTPYLVAAADLRERLGQVRNRLDSAHKDPALDDMVVMGHSMGGLVAKLQAVDSGDKFWRLVSNQPFESLRMKPQTRAEIQRIFFFERQPSVQRVVFLGTPHHGTNISTSPVALLGSQLVQLPKSLKDAAEDVAQQNPQVEFTLSPSRLPTSLEQLAPGAPALQLLAAWPKPAPVHFHSIIGVAPPAATIGERLLGGVPSDEQSDGVVSYSSAHIADADSEVIVPAEHDRVQSHPQTVREVRRILAEHWQTTVRAPSVNEGASPPTP
jgi:pimeloyl-ACP methyl ester carboxylesterase